MFRSTRSSRGGREARPFLRLSVACWRARSRAVDWSALWWGISLCFEVLLISWGIFFLKKKGPVCWFGGSRSSICVKQNMPVFQLLRVRTLLEVLLERVLADVRGGVHGGDGRFINDGAAVLVFGCHTCVLVCCLSICAEVIWVVRESEVLVRSVFVYAQLMFTRALLPAFGCLELARLG